MKKYIEQEAVIRLIQTEGFNEKYDLGHPKDNDWFCEEVNRIPAADVVEVVRCRDCKYKEQNAGRYHVQLPFYCTLHDEKFCDEMEFCSYGAKMDGGSE